MTPIGILAGLAAFFATGNVLLIVVVMKLVIRLRHILIEASFVRCRVCHQRLTLKKARSCASCKELRTELVGLSDKLDPPELTDEEQDND